MAKSSDSKSLSKQQLHPRNRHREAYPFARLIEACPELQPFVAVNAHGKETIDFANPEAVRALNKALLAHYYQIKDWQIPEGYLCPPVPGRADYLHYAADLLAESNRSVIPKGKALHVLDIGMGANVIYPLVGSREYGWQFVGAEVDQLALATATRIIEANPDLTALIQCRAQTDANHCFKQIIQGEEVFDLTLCNPPFHASIKAASAGRQRKWKNLGQSQKAASDKNFGGVASELYFPGGERAFIQNMIKESQHFSHQCLWFTTLVSQKANLKPLYASLDAVKPKAVRTIEMAQGQKSSRILAWTFLDQARRHRWSELRWNRSKRKA